MARKAIYKHATQVNTSSYPDDGTSPVGSNEWNEDPAPQGMYGNTPTTATITIASGVATVTDSVTVVAAESSTSDTLQKLALTNTNQYDLIYLFADTGDTITLEHGDLNADGEISTVSGSNETLSTTTPTILIRKGNYWYGYGGGVVNAVSDIGDVTISGIASGELLKWNGSAWINQTLTEAGIVDGNLGTPSALVGTNISGTAANLTAGNATLAAGATALATARTIGGTSFDGTGNIAITTNANLTGEVTSSGNATTIAGNIVDEANLKVMFKVLRTDSAEEFDDIAWTYFNSTGTSDSLVPISKEIDDFKEYQYSVSDLSEFIAFSIKIVMQGTNSSRPPLVKDFRAIALAL